MSNEAFDRFVEKFKAKKTTDDCYTPANVYEAVAEFVAKEYGLDRGRFVRPFYPGGDYQRFDYAPDAVVVDNPPFSILAQIIRFYEFEKIPFFLFAPGLTTLSAIRRKRATAICTNVSITYENGAVVNTSFVTNLESGTLARSSPELYAAVRAADEANRKEKTKELPKYDYDKHVLQAHQIAAFSRYGIPFTVPRTDAVIVAEIDDQKATGKSIFGCGLLISDDLCQKREKAEREKAEREKAERKKAERWKLSPKELAIVRSFPIPDHEELRLF